MTLHPIRLDFLICEENFLFFFIRVEKYECSTRCSHYAVIIPNRIKKLQQYRSFIYLDQNLKNGLLEFVISFCKVNIWGLELRFRQLLLGSCNQIDEFLYIIYFPTMNSSNLLWKHLLPIITYIFLRSSVGGNRARRNLAYFVQEKKEFKYDKNLAEVSFVKDVSDMM